MTTSAPERVLISSPAAQQSIPAGVPFPLAGAVFLQVGDVAGSPLGREGASPPASPVPSTTYLIDGVPAGGVSFSSLAESIPSSPPSHGDVQSANLHI
jgi:hypothetical protein